MFRHLSSSKKMHRCLSFVAVTPNMAAPIPSADGRHLPSAGHIQLCGHQMDSTYGLLYYLLRAAAKNMAVGEPLITEMFVFHRYELYFRSST